MSSDDFASAVPLPDDIAAALQRRRPVGSPAEDPPAWPPRVLFFPSVTSTNDVAARLAEAGAAHLTTVTAELQTAGRGRLGRSWFSPPGAGLYASVIVRPEIGAGSIFLTPMITLAAGVALAEAVRACTHLPVDIKWPNDLVVGRRKLAGILTEGSGAESLSHVIVGFGINLRSAAYPPEIADRATSVEAELGRGLDRGALLAECLALLAQWNATLRSGETERVLDRWRSLAPSCCGASVEWAGSTGTARGVTEGVDSDGALLVRTARGVERIIAGEVRWL